MLLAQANQPKPEVRQGLQVAESAERSAATQTTAASLTAGAAIAGLKPWDSSWVMQGMEVDRKEKANEMQPLFGRSEPAGAQAPALPTGQELPGAQLLPQIQGSPASAGLVPDEAIRKALESLTNTRGEAAEAMSQLSQGVQGQGSPSFGELGAGMDQLAARSAQSPTGSANPLQATLGNGVETTYIAADGLRNDNGSGSRSGPTASGVFPALSGAEYLTTLSAIRGGNQDSQAGMGAGGQGMGGEAGAGGKLGLRDGNRISKEDGLKGRKPQFGDAMHATLNNGVGLHGAAGQPVTTTGGLSAKSVMTGHVVKGSMSQDRLSSESLIGISDNIRSLAAQGAGEIRVRLRPDHLGELQVRVVTQGNQVGLQIQASDENAKRILEQSMSSLKDSLATQNLSLAQVDLSVAAGQMGSGLGGFQQDSSQNQNQSGQQHLNQQGSGWNQGWNQGNGNGEQMSSWRGSGFGNDGAVSGRGMNRASVAGAAAAQSSGAAGRLDVKA